jgi:sugar/nucleoside kinase (ribokinase family)
MGRRFDILAVGDYCLDLIFSGLPRVPRLGEEVVGTAFTMTAGGAFNAVVAMHRLGLKVGWAADFGDDDFSRFALERARAEGLDDTLFVYHRRPLRRVTVAASFPEDRAFITHYDPDPTLPAGMKALAQVSARALYVPGFYSGALFTAGLGLIRLKKMKLIMDGNSSDEIRLADPAVRETVASVDLFMPNAAEARRMTGESDLLAAIGALAALCPLVVVKDGPGGAYASAGGRVLHASPIPVTPVETTGAGDCFNAGFIRPWLDGRPLAECLQWGNVVGGLSTQAPGGTEKVVTEHDIARWLKSDQAPAVRVVSPDSE